MQKVNFAKEFFTRNSTPRQSTLKSPRFSRSQRTTHQSVQNLQHEMKTQFLSGFSSPNNKNYVAQKSQILMKVDDNIEQKIKKNISLRRLNSKMSILSMQKNKFKINRTKSSFKLSSSFFSNNMNNMNNTSTFFKKNSQIVSNHENTQLKDFNNQGISQNFSFQSFRSYLEVVISNHPRKENERKTEIFSRNLIKYFISVQESQISKQLSEIRSICKELAVSLSDNTHEMQLGMGRLIDRDISKLLFNICYEIYRKKHKILNYEELIKINKDMEYSARRLKFFQLTLRILLDLGQLFCDQMQYEKAFQQYTHAVKLAIFTNNKYYQEIAIDKLGICKYYMGDSVSALYFHNNLNHISHYDINRIKTQYSNQKEIQRLVQQKNHFKPTRYIVLSKQNYKKRTSKTDIFQEQQNFHNESYSQKIDIGEFTFEKENRNQFYPIINNSQMKSNLKKIIKMPDLREKVHILKRNLKKNDFIGTKKYCGQKYVIPTASISIKKQNNFQMNEVCLSHRSFNRHNTEAYSSSLDRDSRIMVTVLNYFMNQNFIGKSS